MKFAHIITGIPVGSKVVVFSCARFPNFEEVVNTGAIGMTTSLEGYPLKVSVRSNRVGNLRGDRKIHVVIPIDPNTVEGMGFTGGEDFDLVINNVKEYNPSGEEIYIPFNPRIGPWTEVAIVNAPEKEETKIKTCLYCLHCGVKILTGTQCFKCAKPTHCEEPVSDNGKPVMCGKPLVAGLLVCEDHARQYGFDIEELKKHRARRKPGRPHIKRGRKKMTVQVDLGAGI